jgi:histone H2A
MVKVLLKQRKRPTLSKQAGLTFPVKKVKRLLEKVLNDRVQMTAAVYMTALLEYITAEVTELSGNACREQAARALPKVIRLRHLRAGIAGDDELDRMMSRLSVKHRTAKPRLQTDSAKVSPVDSRLVTELVAIVYVLVCRV